MATHLDGRVLLRLAPRLPARLSTPVSLFWLHPPPAPYKPARGDRHLGGRPPGAVATKTAGGSLSWPWALPGVAGRTVLVAREPVGA